MVCFISSSLGFTFSTLFRLSLNHNTNKNKLFIKTFDSSWKITTCTNQPLLIPRIKNIILFNKSLDLFIFTFVRINHTKLDSDVLSISNIIVSGPMSSCLACGHGGHTEHLQDWFRLENMCPSGCGCHCPSETASVLEQWCISRAIQLW